MFADDIKLGSRSDNVSSIQLVVDRAAECIDRNCMILNAAMRQRLHFGGNACPNLVFSGLTGVLLPIPQAHYAAGICVGYVRNNLAKSLHRYLTLLLRLYLKCRMQLAMINRTLANIVGNNMPMYW